jgi:hypothetical protein
MFGRFVGIVLSLLEKVQFERKQHPTGRVFEMIVLPITSLVREQMSHRVIDVIADRDLVPIVIAVLGSTFGENLGDGQTRERREQVRAVGGMGLFAA